MPLEDLLTFYSSFQEFNILEDPLFLEPISLNEKKNSLVDFYHKKAITSTGIDAVNAIDIAVKKADYYHSFFHFVGYVININCSSLLKNENNKELSLKHLDHAKFLCPLMKENGIFEKPTNHCLKEEGIFHIFENFWHDKPIKEDNLSLWLKMEEISRTEHFHYHCVMAVLFANKAILNQSRGCNEIAIACFEKSLNFDKKCPQNAEIEKRYLQLKRKLNLVYQ